MTTRHTKHCKAGWDIPHVGCPSPVFSHGLCRKHYRDVLQDARRYVKLKQRELTDAKKLLARWEARNP